MRPIVVPIVLALSSLAACAGAAPPPGVQSTSVPRPPATVADLDWLMGDWAGTGIDGHPAGESFSRVGSDRMVGHFWQLDGTGGVRFYELITIEPEGESLVMRLKHFHADLTGWEAREGDAALHFQLRAREPGKWVFGPATFTQVGPDRLKVSVAMDNRTDGSPASLEFDYRRLPPR